MSSRRADIPMPGNLVGPLPVEEASPAVWYVGRACVGASLPPYLVRASDVKRRVLLLSTLPRLEDSSSRTLELEMIREPPVVARVVLVTAEMTE